MPTRIVTPPAMEPVTLPEMKAWARIDATGDAVADAANDALLSSLITTAREEAENILRRSIMPQAIELTLSGFPGWGQGVELPRPPLVAVESVTFFDAANAAVVMDEAAYVVLNVSDAETPSLCPTPGGFWPDTSRRPDAVAIRYTAGWPVTGTGAEADPDAGTPADPFIIHVPENIKTWIKMRVSTMWANRENIITGNSATFAAEIPSRFLDGLLDRWRIMRVV